MQNKDNMRTLVWTKLPQTSANREYSHKKPQDIKDFLRVGVPYDKDIIL